MNKIPVNQAFREITKEARDLKGISNIQIAEALKKQAPWVSKFFQGGVKNISHKDMVALEELLGLDYFGIDRKENSLSPLARKIAGTIDSDDAFAKAIAHIHTAFKLQSERSNIPEVHQKELIKIGAQITTIVMRWEESNDPHYAKIAGETLDYLRDFFRKKEK